MDISTDYVGGWWTAIDNDRYDGAPDAGPQQIGHGRTEAEAIVDLREQIEDAEAF